jgi:hypothetical protein
MQRPAQEAATVRKLYSLSLRPRLTAVKYLFRSDNIISTNFRNLAQPRLHRKSLAEVVFVGLWSRSPTQTSGNISCSPLRGIIMGDLFFNLGEGRGWETIRMNYMGDWRHEYGFYPVGWKRFGSEGPLSADSFSGKYDGLRK